jgi:hypothetical protein
LGSEIQPQPTTDRSVVLGNVGKRGLLNPCDLRPDVPVAFAGIPSGEQY